MAVLEERYAGKPMLRLLDAYVLDALGALDEKTARDNAAMSSRIAQALKVDAATWQGAVERAMQMPPDSAEALRALWEQHVHATLGNGGTPDVLAWTHDVVDARFQSA